jgi:outer membrane protein OmpA-like peptidoglycan-associated protein
LKAQQEAEAAAAAQKAKDEADAAAAQKAKDEADAAALKAQQDAEAAAAQKAKQEADMEAEAKADAEAQKAKEQRKTTAETDACEKRLTEAAAKGVILFNRARADIDPKSSLTIAKLSEIIKACPGARVEVEGHTDSEGEPDRNQRLSERRARAVVRSLVHAGVAEDRLSAVGYGAERPVATNDTADGMARNRRIEFKVFSN